MPASEKTVVFLGLVPRHIPRSKIEKPGSEIWTLNDWYLFHPWLKTPGRIYQIHSEVRETANRAVKWWDNNEAAAARGSKIVTLRDWRFSNQQIRDQERLDAVFGKWFFAFGTFGWMFADAIAENVDRVELHGWELGMGGEYERQRPGMLMCVDAARAAGVDVFCVMEEEWRRSCAGVDLARLKSVSLTRYDGFGKRRAALRIYT